jgi:hypothetical protein
VQPREREREVLCYRKTELALHKKVFLLALRYKEVILLAPSLSVDMASDMKRKYLSMECVFLVENQYS